jgi:hypothetical protein
MSADAEKYEAPPLLCELALEAMECGLDPAREEKALDLMERIYLGYGHQGIYTMVQIWADITLDAMGCPQLPDGSRLVGVRKGLEDVVVMGLFFDSAAAWAARFVLARADLSHDDMSSLYDELMATSSGDGYLYALLRLAAAGATVGAMLGRVPGSQ